MDKFVTRTPAPEKADKVEKASPEKKAPAKKGRKPEKAAEPKGKKRKADDAPLEGEPEQKKPATDEGATSKLIDGAPSGLMSDTITDKGWKEILKAEFAKPYYKKIEDYVANERQLVQVFPPNHEVYNMFNFTPFEKVKVVIVGQDPYFNPGQGEGLCFSVKKGVTIPPSLNRIYKVIAATVPGFKIPKHGSLEAWAKQGILMINATLTVESGKPNSHAKCGWQEFTTAVMKILNEKKEGIIYLLWGGFAQKKGAFLDKKKNHVLTAAHPSPMGGSAWNSCTHFADVNRLLKEMGKEPIDWTL